MVRSNDYPEIVRLQGDIITPYCINAVEIEDEAGTRTEYQYLEHRTPDTGQQLPSVDEQRSIVYEACENALHAHIFARYPLPTQTTIESHAIEAVIADRQDILAACRAVREWCNQCVLYFKDCVQKTYTQDPLTVIWDYQEDLPAPDELPTLSDIMAMWSDT